MPDTSISFPSTWVFYEKTCVVSMTTDNTVVSWILGTLAIHANLLLHVKKIYILDNVF